MPAGPQTGRADGQSTDARHSTHTGIGGGRIVLDGREMAIWDVPAGKVRSVLPGCRSRYNNVALSQDARIALVILEDSTIKPLDLAAGCFVSDEQNLKIPLGATTVGLSPDGTWLACSYARGMMQLWKVK